MMCCVSKRLAFAAKNVNNKDIKAKIKYRDFRVESMTNNCFDKALKIIKEIKSVKKGINRNGNFNGPVWDDVWVSINRIRDMTIKMNESLLFTKKSLYFKKAKTGKTNIEEKPRAIGKYPYPPNQWM